ncbi:peptidoglycan editing factor PgeF [Spirulina major]|uniref:peptidoglycan editing factor PgeF n=1 Tax=Spirulina major TaxID=270636 RepID=UPI000934CD42|nr:peptidoglycan editing factor PgeF [Spirulina major]
MPFSDPAHDAPGWQWQTIATGQPYLTAEVLSAWPHGFFTTAFAPQPPSELVTMLHPTAPAYRLKQVHGKAVLTPTAIAAHPEHRPDGDAAVTETPAQSVWVASADCTPVLIGDRTTGRTAAIHSGWRGTALGIVPATVAQMVAMGSQTTDLRFALGPAIAGEVYQVTTHVGAEVAASLNRCDGLAPDEAIALLLAEPEPALLPDSQPGRVRLDVRQIIRRQLTDLGIPAAHYAIAPCCTYQQPHLFFSYRRTHEKQVQWSGIVSIPPTP